jgi:RND family efflux transporter MFP subunit
MKNGKQDNHANQRRHRTRSFGAAAGISLLGIALLGIALLGIALGCVALTSCSGNKNPGVEASTAAKVTVGVTRVVRRNLTRHLVLSSELVPFQEIDVYAKEAGYVKKLYVDYGTRVKAGQVLATLEIPELEAQLQEDEAEVKNAEDVVTRTQHELRRYQAEYKVSHLEYTRLNGVFESQPGIVAQQEVDDAQGKDLAAASQVDSAQAAVQAAGSALNAAKAKLLHDQTLYDYSKITAPFPGVVTERYANLGTLVQAGTSSSTQAMPIVRLSQDDLFRLVIPVPESYVRYIKIGQPVDVNVPSLNRTFPGKVARFSVDVNASTRTMHTEVDISNPQRLLVPGIYAEADLVLQQENGVPAVPLQAINHEGEKTTVLTVGSDGKLEDTTVVLGLETADDAEVISGLHEGDQVVVSDRSGLKAGQTVRTREIQVAEYHERT